MKIAASTFAATPVRCLYRAANLRTRILISAMVAVALAAISPAGTKAQSPQAADMLKRAFQSREFSGHFFGPARWLENGNAYTTVERSADYKGARDVVRYETATGQRTLLIAASELIPAGAKEPLEIEDYEWSSDMNRVLIYTNAKRVWRAPTRGDYWLYDRPAKTLKKLGGSFPESSLMFATFSPDGTRVAYVHENNLYVEDVASHTITQLTHDGSTTIINGTSDWVYEEELDIRNAFRWSPDGKRIAYWQFNSAGVRNFALIYDVGAPYDVVTHIPYPEYGPYPYVKEIPYPEPGTPNSIVHVGVVSAEGGETKWMEIPGDPANNYIARMDWADANSLVIQHVNRRQDNNDVLVADASSGAVTTAYSEHDDAWVDVVNDMQWLHGGKDFLWVNEKDGWRHVFVISRDGKQARPVTKGDFDVTAIVGVDPKEEWLYYEASPDNATQRYLFRTRLDGTGTPARISPANEPGAHNYDISPDFAWAFHTYSSFDSPPVTELIRLPDHQVARTMEDNAALRAKIKDIAQPPVEYTKVDLGDGVTVDAWMIKPVNFDPSKKYPALVYVYGEPAGQTVEDRWGGETWLFHRILSHDGYVVMSIDNRGTPAPRGRAWRKIIYGTVGVLSSKEQAAGLQALERKYPFIDSSRVGVWGWSGGGTNTLNLMFRSPDLYKVGMSVAPVPDQRLYDSIYQERYMGLPQDNADGYKAASAINYADGLKGHLLIVHSSGDDNVHYQGTELLVNRLVELGKPFDFMEYPGRTHGLSEGPGTHFHLYSLLTRYLETNLPAGTAN
jgi:dipeptidyl-peptidase-4